MQHGIIGLPQSGKTTLYKSTYACQYRAEMSTGQMEVHTSVVDVPTRACTISFGGSFAPKRSWRAKVTYADICRLGWQRGACRIARSDGQSTRANWMVFCTWCANLKTPASRISPQHRSPAERTIQTMDTEFMLNDLVMVERRLEKLKEETPARCKPSARCHPG
jgi:ribosome-binding ATPase YchF (GTP1/OBG family)